MVASLKSADLQIVETFKKSIDIYFKYVSIKEDKENKELIKEFTDRYIENMQSDEIKFYKRYET